MPPINKDISKEWRNSSYYIQAAWHKRAHYLVADFLLEQGIASMESGRLTLKCLVNVTCHACENTSL